MEPFDLNLLRTFDALLETRSVTEASLDLGLSVPATSRALARLREALGDPVLVRAGRGLVPTPYAESIAARVHALVEEAHSLRADSRLDDPATWQGTITIRANEGMIPIVGSILTPQIAEHAPGVVIHFVAEGDEGDGPLRDGGVDLDVGVRSQDAPDIVVEQAVTTPFVAVTAGDPRDSGGRMSLEEFCRTPHVSTSRRGRTRGPIDVALEEIGRSRRVVAVYPSVASAVFMATQGLIVPVPRLLADEVCAMGMSLRWCTMPVQTSAIDVALAWHRRVALEPPVTWVRQRLVEGLRQRAAVGSERAV